MSMKNEGPWRDADGFLYPGFNAEREVPKMSAFDRGDTDIVSWWCYRDKEHYTGRCDGCDCPQGEAEMTFADTIKKLNASLGLASEEKTYNCPIHGDLGGINYCPRC